MASAGTPHKRSFTGHHALMPASRDHTRDLFVSIVPTRAFISWTFGRGTVVRITLVVRMIDRVRADGFIRFGGCGRRFCCTPLLLLVSHYSVYSIRVSAEPASIAATFERLSYFFPIAVVVSVSMKTNFKMDVPPVLLTVLGMPLSHINIAFLLNMFY